MATFSAASCVTARCVHASAVGATGVDVANVLEAPPFQLRRYTVPDWSPE